MNLTEKEMELLDNIARIEGWISEKIRYEPVLGGITNNNWKVEYDGKRYFVKIPGKGTNAFIDRKNCHAANMIAQNTGIGPKVHYFFPDNGVEVFEWIEGYVPMRFGDVFVAEKLYKMIDAIKKFHQYKEIRLPLVQNAFEQTVHMIRLARDLKGYIPKEIDRMEWLVKSIEDAILTAGIDFVPCHNDLWSSNYVWNEKEKAVMLLDYEYSSMNDFCYDFGIWTATNYFDEGMERELVCYYFGEFDEKIFARIKLYKIVQDIKWAMWSCVQAVNSPVTEYDYFQWLGTKMSRLRLFWSDPRLDYWISVVKGASIF